MSEVTTNSALNQQTYRADGGETPAKEVHRAICVLLPRALLIGSFDNNGKIINACYTDYRSALPEWITDFFEHQFITDPILSGEHKTNTIFVASDKNLLVPNALYNDAEAENWLQKTTFVEATDTISDCWLKAADVHYLYAWPTAIKKLLAKYFTNAQILPFAAHQFLEDNRKGYYLECCITEKNTYATFYNNNKIQWHQVFAYQNAEDIAYRIKLVCQQYQATLDNITCTIASNNQLELRNELSHYFPGIENKTGHTEWTSTISLLQQLYACG